MLKTSDKWALALRLSIVTIGGFSLFYYVISSNLLNILAYFTFQSNLFVFLYFMASLKHTYHQSKAGKMDWDYKPNLKGFVTLMIAITGIVYAFILTPLLLTSTPEELMAFGMQQTPLRTIRSIILHYYIPFAVIMDWLFISKKGVYTFRKTFPWLFYPLAYILMIYLRAPFINDPVEKYIYPFFDPALMQGWLIPFILFLWLFFSGVVYLFVYFDQCLAKKKNLP